MSNENIGIFTVRVASNKVTFKKLQAQQDKELQKKINKYNSIERKEINSSDIGGTVILEDIDSGDRLDLGENVMIDTSRTKNIVATQINGQIGTIKEWINDGDVIITLLIIINDDNEGYPTDKLRDIMKFLTKNKTLKIYNKHINDILGITRIVITSWKHTPETWNSSQEITVDAMSDETYKIETQFLKNN